MPSELTEGVTLNELYDFLMFDLTDMSEIFDTESERAHESCVLMSVDGYPVPETFFRLYTSSLEISEEVLMNAVSYFSGAEVLKIECDCSEKQYCDIPKIPENDFFLLGQKDKSELSPSYATLINEVFALRKEFAQ